ncbi:MAG: hypothetical protein AAGG38_05155 [Planctomycetota bacterium]
MNRCPHLTVLTALMASLFAAALTACGPSDRLHFRTLAPPTFSDSAVRYDTDRDGRADFQFSLDRSADRLDELAYDDNQDGQPDRRYRLSDYPNDQVPHLIVLIDSIPFFAIVERLRGKPHSVLHAFYPPAKVIAPYPSMSAVCFTDILRAPPMPGPINRHYDPRPQHRRVNNLIRKRFAGYRNPWQQRLHYNIDYRDNGTAFLMPRPWLHAEFERARLAFDESPDRTTVIYIASSASMLFKYQHAGLEEALDELERFVLQVLYERRGAVKISIASDHGHNLAYSTWLDIEQNLRDAGYRPTDRPRKPGDVHLEMDGLLTWFGVHTDRPAEVADALLARQPHLETFSYVEGHAVIVRSHLGRATVTLDERQRFTYSPDSADVLGLGSELSGVPLTRDQWLARTADHPFPDAPPRLWDAFHRGTRNVPQLMATLQDGYCAGIEWFQWFVTPHSTHGGLNQINSAAFAMTMRQPIPGPLRSRDVLAAFDPEYVPRLVSPPRR